MTNMVALCFKLSYIMGTQLSDLLKILYQIVPKKLHALSLTNVNTKFSKNISKLNPATHKKIMCHDQVGIIQGNKNVSTYVNQTMS